MKQTEQPKEYLGPPSKKNPTGIKPLVPVNIISKAFNIYIYIYCVLKQIFLNKYSKSIVKRPDNAWNYEKQREKFKFLTDQPICSCGAGKYD